MPSGVIQAVGKSRTGKPTVTIDGQIYSAPKVDTSKLTVGDRIEFDFSSSVYNGATIWFLNGFKLLQAALPTSVSPTGSGQIAAPSAPQQALKGLSEGERLTVSNWVAAAIQAGKVQGPADLISWARGALNAARSAADPDYIPF